MKMMIGVVVVLILYFLMRRRAPKGNGVKDTIVSKKDEMDWKGNNGLGFVVVRHVRDRTTGMYWLEAVRCIRRFYPDAPIVVVDDNSDQRFTRDELRPPNCAVVASEYPGRAEMLGYYYYWKHHWFERAVIMHDSVFIQRKVDFKCPGGVRFLWHFDIKIYDDVPLITEYLDKIDPCYKPLFEDKKAWKGCFGVMSVIRHDFLEKISGIFRLLGDVEGRDRRMAFERVFAVVCVYHLPTLMRDLSLMGDILDNPLGWGYGFDAYQRERNKVPMPALVKVWSGR